MAVIQVFLGLFFLFIIFLALYVIGRLYFSLEILFNDYKYDNIINAFKASKDYEGRTSIEHIIFGFLFALSISIILIILYAIGKGLSELIIK